MLQVAKRLGLAVVNSRSFGPPPVPIASVRYAPSRVELSQERQPMKRGRDSNVGPPGYASSTQAQFPTSSLQGNQAEQPREASKGLSVMPLPDSPLWHQQEARPWGYGPAVAQSPRTGMAGVGLRQAGI